MGAEAADGPEAVGAMRKRRTLMADGRYLIYYTFGGEEGDGHAAERGAAARREPEAEAEAGEERGV